MEQSPFERACDLAGGLVRLAERIGKKKQTLMHYKLGVPDEAGPLIEEAIAFQVLTEDLCPPAERWVRIPADGWPTGKPFLDVTSVSSKRAAAKAAREAQGESEPEDSFEAASHPVACDDPQMTDAKCLLSSEGPRNEYQQFLGYSLKREGEKKPRSDDKPSNPKEGR